MLTDDEILAELESLPVLPDQYLAPRMVNPVWEDEQVIAQLNRYFDLCTLIVERKLRAGVLLLLARACYGDFDETMFGLPKRFIKIFDPDLDALAEICIQTMKSPQKGTRLWALRTLRVLLIFHRIDDRHVLRTLMDALYDSAYQVRDTAIWALENAGELADYREIIVPGLEEFLLEQSDTVHRVRELLGNIQSQT